MVSAYSSGLIILIFCILTGVARGVLGYFSLIEISSADRILAATTLCLLNNIVC